MSIELIRDILGWCAVINLALFLLWFLFFSCAHDWVYRLHSKWFPLSEEKFNEIHYAAMAFYKMGLIFLNITPYLAIRIVL